MLKVLEIESASADDTRLAGIEIAKRLPAQAVVLLTGDLGAGKTTLTKGITEGRGAAKPDEVSSPTFTLIHEYGEPVTVYHADLYRLETLAQAARLGLEEIFERPALVLVEWGERFLQLFPPDTWQIWITQVGDGDGRKIELFSPGPTPLELPAQPELQIR